LENHSVFADAIRNDHFRNHDLIYFLQLAEISPAVVQKSNGMSAPTLDVDLSYPIPMKGDVTEIDRLYDSPDHFLKNWSNWPKEIFTFPMQRRQIADFLSSLNYAFNAFPNTDILLWEDDCLFCPDTFSFISRFRAFAAGRASRYASLRIGYGASGT
jgi:hypothetical protein